MIFSSIPFLYYFLPVVLLVYGLTPRVGKNAVLLLFSLVFYGWGEPKYLAVMLVCTALGYGFGLALGRAGRPGVRKALLAASVLSSLSFLVYFKYADFFLSNFNALTGASLPLLQMTLPVGISFYTFQILSYTVDVYRGEAQVQKNPIDLACYVTMFPQLIAGPIVRYTDVAEQLKQRGRGDFQKGASRFLVGLGKKILFANLLGEVCAAWRGTQDGSVLFSWLYAVSYTLHIYFDFSGYSDMAIGLGALLGFRFPENFNYPYIAASVTEFWRRWHMTLSRWFRDYVYIPLGGNRKGMGKQLRNILIVWLLTGFWHGAAWNFLCWGLYFAALLILEKLVLLRFLEKHRIFGHVYLLLAVVFGFVLFDAATLSGAWDCIRGMLGLGGLPIASAEGVYLLKSNALLLILAALGATPLPKRIAKVLEARCPKAAALLHPAALCALLLICTAYLVDGSYNPFLYFRF
ncbi:MAG: MBOAT family O-acyltransferase [Candidatus Faecousia sp.]|nr:MBOAT family O-acyltransferase [Candidatus Faecousia sp.]